MNAHLIQDNNYIRKIIDTIPSGIFVVDDDFKILDLNPSAKELFKLKSEATLYRLCGDVLNCKHAIESAEGCGTTNICRDCVFRNSVESACNGKKTHKKKYTMEIKLDDKYSDLHMLVTTTPFNYEGDNFVLMAIEDISEVTTLKRLIPICASCKKIRNDENYWEEVADYLKKHSDLEFTHGICPDCKQKLYTDLS